MEHIVALFHCDVSAVQLSRSILDVKHVCGQFMVHPEIANSYSFVSYLCYSHGDFLLRFMVRSSIHLAGFRAIFMLYLLHQPYHSAAGQMILAITIGTHADHW